MSLYLIQKLQSSSEQINEEVGFDERRAQQYEHIHRMDKHSQTKCQKQKQNKQKKKDERATIPTMDNTDPQKTEQPLKEQIFGGP